MGAAWGHRRVVGCAGGPPRSHSSAAVGPLETPLQAPSRASMDWTTSRCPRNRVGLGGSGVAAFYDRWLHAQLAVSQTASALTEPCPALAPAQVGVEELALQHYASPEGGGWRGLHRCGACSAWAWEAARAPGQPSLQPGLDSRLLHRPACLCSEGGIWATLFGLLLWEELFMPLPDVFRTPFQAGPGRGAGSGVGAALHGCMAPILPALLVVRCRRARVAPTPLRLSGRLPPHRRPCFTPRRLRRWIWTALPFTPPARMRWRRAWPGWRPARRPICCRRRGTRTAA